MAREWEGGCEVVDAGAQGAGETGGGGHLMMRAAKRGGRWVGDGWKERKIERRMNQDGDGWRAMEGNGGRGKGRRTWRRTVMDWEGSGEARADSFCHFGHVNWPDGK